MKKRVLLYLGKISKSHGGVFQYSSALIKTLGRVSGESIELFLYADKNSQLLEEIDLKLFKIIHPDEVVVTLDLKLKNLSARILRIIRNRILKIRTEKLYLYNELDVVINENGIDIIHFPNQILIQRKNVKTISTMHDVQELHFPEFFSSQQRAYRATNYKRIIDQSDAIVVSYDHIKVDIIKYFQIEEKKVHIVLLEMQNLWFDKMNKNLLLPKEYESFILFPAATWPHKNHIRLLKAIKHLRESESIRVNLICTGHLNEHFQKNIAPYIVENDLSNQVSFLGIVNNDHLYSLYQNCIGIVIPTLYEAGSFPLVESILMERPVICSNITSLPETIGNKDYNFNPYIVVEIAEKTKQLWLSEEFRKENKLHLKKMKKRLTETMAHQKFEHLYNSLID